MAHIIISATNNSFFVFIVFIYVAAKILIFLETPLIFTLFIIH